MHGVRVVSLSQFTFGNSVAFDGNISGWDTSQVTTLYVRRFAQSTREI